MPIPRPSASLPSWSQSTIDIRTRKPNNDDKTSSSPYYKGLTDSSLALNNKSDHAPSVKSFNSIIIDKIMKLRLRSCFGFKSIPHRPVSSGSLLPSPVDTLMGAKLTLVKEVTTSAQPLRGGVKTEPRTLSVPNKVGGYSWADKYRPRSLTEFICNRDKAEYLKTLMKRGDCGHFIFKGPPGVGKRTMIWGMLGEAFGPHQLQAREDCDTFVLKGRATKASSSQEIGEGEGGSSIRVNVKTCLERVEVSVGDNLGYEKLVELIKEAQTKLSIRALKNTIDNCRAIIIYEAEKMSEESLLYIRWLLERYKGYNKVFFCCSDISKLHHVNAICTTIELLPPSKPEIVEVLKFIADKESIELPIELANRIAEYSNSNLRQAIRSFEATSRICCSLNEDQMILTGWEDDISNIAKNIVKEQSSKQLYIIRGELQNLIDHNVSGEFICQSLVEELKKHLDEEHHYIVDDLYDEYNNGENEAMDIELNIDPSNINCDQCFSRMEEFIAKFMSTYKSLLTSKKP